MVSMDKVKDKASSLSTFFGHPFLYNGKKPKMLRKVSIIFATVLGAPADKMLKISNIVYS